MTSTTVVRRPKWHPPPPPTPRILHLPRRVTSTTCTRRRKKQNLPANKSILSGSDPVHHRRTSPKGRLETLFDQERAFSYSIPPIVLLNSGDRVERRRRSSKGSCGGEEEEEGRNVDVKEEEEEEGKWRFQAEMLRAECKYLRMEREIAVKKLEKERWILEKTLKSTVHALVSGKEKIQEGENSDKVLEEEIAELAKKLMELQRSSRLVRDPELQFCGGNFDKQASVLEKQLDKLSSDKYVKDIRDFVVASLSIRDASSMDNSVDKEESSSSRKCTRFPDVETMKKKMEGLSKGKLLQRMEEEYGSMLRSTATATRSVPSSASTSMRYELPELSSSFQQSLQEMKPSELKTSCSGHCKAIVRRIMEQVRAETQQWSQMQEMLGQVREEMEGLQSSRDFWEHRAVDSDHKIQSLQSLVQEWKQKALTLEDKEKQLQKQVKTLQLELGKLRLQQSPKMQKSSPLTFGELHEKEKRALSGHVNAINQASKNFSRKKDGFNDGKKTLDKSGNNIESPSRIASPNRLSLQEIGKKPLDKGGNKIASPQRIACPNPLPLKEMGKKAFDKSRNKIASPNRPPLKEIGNFSPLLRQNSKKLIYPLCSPQHTYSAR